MSTQTLDDAHCFSITNDTVNEPLIQLFSNELYVQSDPVQTLPPSIKKSSMKLHPLDAAVHKKINRKRKHRNNYSPVIQSVPLEKCTSTKAASIITSLANGAQIMWIPENAQIVSVKTTENFEEAEAVQIPLTVQNYKHDDKLKQMDKANDEDDEEDEHLQPGFDDEPDPDPDPSSQNNPVKCTVDDNQCYMCFKVFVQKKNLYAHIRRVHSAQPNAQGTIICPLCKMQVLRQQHLRTHLETLHNIEIQHEEKLFDTMEDFQQWKQLIERETASFFVSKSSAKLLANNQSKLYFKCHRSGMYVPRGDSRKGASKHHVRSSNTYKIGATCPAAMEITENVHGVTVKFWSTHVGHDINLADLSLSKMDRKKISILLNSGMSFDDILNHLRRESDVSPEKIDLLTKHDLRYLKKSLQRDFSGEPKNLGRKPIKQRLLRRVTPADLIDKADLLLNILETTEIIPELRPKVCLMIDNLIATVKRSAVNNVHHRENSRKLRKKKETLKNIHPMLEET